jgi:hypothetical protein
MMRVLRSISWFNLIWLSAMVIYFWPMVYEGAYDACTSDKLRQWRQNLRTEPWRNNNEYKNEAWKLGGQAYDASGAFECTRRYWSPIVDSWIEQGSEFIHNQKAVKY